MFRQDAAFGSRGHGAFDLLLPKMLALEPCTGGAISLQRPQTRRPFRSAQGPDGGPPSGGGTPYTPRPGSVVREFLKSAQAASPQRHTDQVLTESARGSRSVVREFLRSEVPDRRGHTGEELGASWRFVANCCKLKKHR
jgi:hypothetical protein